MRKKTKSKKSKPQKNKTVKKSSLQKEKDEREMNLVNPEGLQKLFKPVCLTEDKTLGDCMSHDAAMKIALEHQKQTLHSVDAETC